MIDVFLEKVSKTECSSCGKEGKRTTHIVFTDIDFSVGLCVKCLKHLREQVDAFRILVLTGEDTK